MGLGGAPFGRAPPPSAVAASLGLSSSLLRSFSMPDARSSVPRPAVVSRNDWIFSLIVDWYRGKSPASCASWVASRLPIANITAKAIITTLTTANPRGIRTCCSSPTRGASTKLSKIANAIGMMISRPKYSTITMMAARIAVATALSRAISSSGVRALKDCLITTHLDAGKAADCAGKCCSAD